MTDKGVPPGTDDQTSAADAQVAPSPDAWLRSGEYLPEFLRDFHDQKDVFKALDEVVERSRSGGNHYLDDMNFVAAQVYTVDVFLWCMARRGYTLQRSRKRVKFADMAAFVAEAKARRNAQYAASLRRESEPPAQTAQTDDDASGRTS